MDHKFVNFVQIENGQACATVLWKICPPCLCVSHMTENDELEFSMECNFHWNACNQHIFNDLNANLFLLMSCEVLEMLSLSILAIFCTVT